MLTERMKDSTNARSDNGKATIDKRVFFSFWIFSVIVPKMKNLFTKTFLILEANFPDQTQLMISYRNYIKKRIET